MADFNLWVDTPGKRRYNRIYGSVLYSDDVQDQGNYNSLGQLVGTMRSISAPAYEDWIGRPPTAEDMLAISPEIAKAIYKAKFWDKVQGDAIKSQVLAEMVADMKSSAGGNGVKRLQEALAAMGYSLPIDGSVGSGTLQALNQAIDQGKAAEIYERYRVNMLDYYNTLNPYYREGWARDMEKYYPKREANDPIFADTAAANTKNIGRDVLVTILIFFCIFGLLKLAGKSKFLLLLLVIIPFLPPL